MQDQLSHMWRQFQRQPPVLQASLLLTPFLAAAVVVLAAVFLTGPRTANRTPAPPPIGTPTVATGAAATGAVTTGAVATGTPVPASTPAMSPGSTPATSPAPAVPLIVATTPPSPEATPSPEPTPSPVPSNVYRIANTEGTGASLRREPGAIGQRIRVIPEGREVEALGPTREAGGSTWRSVRDDEGNVGWVATDFLSNIPVDPRVTATPLPLTIQVVDVTEAPGRGEEAIIAIRTRPGVRCEVRVFLYGPSTLPREGLAPMTADDEGVCGWTWTVPEATVPGTWRYFVVVGLGDRQVSREVSFTVR